MPAPAFLTRFKTLPGRVVWADLQKPNKWGAFTLTITVDKRTDEWAAFCKQFKELCDHADIPASPEDNLKNLGEWGSNMLNEVDDTDAWKESDLMLVFKTKSSLNLVDKSIRCGDSVHVAYGMNPYSFETEEGDTLEGISLYLNGALKL